MKKILFFLLLSVSISQAQSILEEQYQFNNLAINPAFAGAKGNFNLNILLGNQFNGTIRPQQISQILSMDGPIRQDRGGLGLQVYNNRFVNLQSLGGNLMYAHRFNLGEVFSLALGVQGGFINYPSSINRINSTVSTNFGGGLLLQTSSFYLGVSKPIIGVRNAEIALPVARPVYANAGFSFGDIEGTMINPSATLITGDIKGFHLNAKAWFKRKTGVGISLRNENKTNKVILMGEYQVSQNLRLGLSYDSKPYNNVQIPVTGGGSIFTQRPIVQLFIRYENIQDGQVVRRLRYF